MSDRQNLVDRQIRWAAIRAERLASKGDTAYQPAIPRPPPPPRRPLNELAALCLTCNHFRPTVHGARCTHRQCGCHGPETTPPVELHGVAFSPQLVNLLTRRASCPDGRW